MQSVLIVSMVVFPLIPVKLCLELEFIENRIILTTIHLTGCPPTYFSVHLFMHLEFYVELFQSCPVFQ
jgi:hypothetical protein